MVANSIKEATGGSLLAPVADNKSQADKEVSCDSVSQESCTTSISLKEKCIGFINNPEQMFR